MRLDKTEFPIETDKPCPFCASRELVCDNSGQGEEWVCWCANCGAIGPNDVTYLHAIEIWNLRRPMDTVMKHVQNALDVIGAEK